MLLLKCRQCAALLLAVDCRVERGGPQTTVRLMRIACWTIKATDMHSEYVIIIFINCNWVVTRWQWLFYMYTKHEIGY